MDRADELKRELISDLIAIGRQPEPAVQRCGEYGRRCIEADLLHPTVVGFCPDGLLFAPIPFANYEQKKEVTRSVAVALAQTGTSLAVVIADGWLSKQNAVRPSADPKRTEALTVNAVNPDGTVAAMLVNPYERTTSGIEWGDLQHSDSSEKREQHFLPAWSGLANLLVSAPFVN